MDSEHFSAFFPVTGRCNLSCRYCFYNTGHEERGGEYDFSDDARFLDALGAAGGRTLIITGGEPLRKGIREKTLQFMGKAKEKDFNLFLVTNGTCIDEYAADSLSDILDTVPYFPQAGSGGIVLSLDSHSGEEHDYLRGGYDSAVGAIKRLAVRGIPMEIVSVMTTRNTDVRKTYRFLKDLGAGDVVFQPAYIPEGKDAHGLGIDKLPRNDLEGLFTDLEGWAHDSGCETYLELMRNWFLGGETDLGQRCYMGNESLVVYPDGRAADCFHNEHDLGSIYNPRDFKSRRSEYLSGKERLPGCFGLHCMSLFA